MLSQFKGLEGQKRKPSAMLGYNHILGWRYNDGLKPPGREDPSRETGRISVASSDSCLYLTNPVGHGISKVGSGHNFSLRGHVYATNDLAGSGFIAHVQGTLLHRTLDQDEEDQEILAQKIDPVTLDMLETITIPERLKIRVDLSSFTINLISDGSLFMWVRAVKLPEEHAQRLGISYAVIVDFFTVDHVFLVWVFSPKVHNLAFNWIDFHFPFV